MTGLFVSCLNTSSNFTQVTPESDLSFEVTKVRNEHGMTIFNEKYIIHFSSELIGEPPAFFKPRIEPIGGYNSLEEWHPQIYDVRVPYQFDKKENDEIINIIKLKDTLRFRLQKE